MILIRPEPRPLPDPIDRRHRPIGLLVLDTYLAIAGVYLMVTAGDVRLDVLQWWFGCVLFVAGPAHSTYLQLRRNER